jgi:hypothetical protein
VILKTLKIITLHNAITTTVTATTTTIIAAAAAVVAKNYPR